MYNRRDKSVLSLSTLYTKNGIAFLYPFYYISIKNTPQLNTPR